MKTIIAGTRNASFSQVMEGLSKAQELDSRFNSISQVICGGAQGADSHGATWADELAIPVRYFRADWKTHGKAAGPIRNREMAQNAEALIAIWDGTSKGTHNMIKESKRAGLLIFVYRTDTEKATLYNGREEFAPSFQTK